MKKIKLKFENEKTKTLDWNGQKFKVNPIINNENKLYIYSEIERCYNERIKEKEAGIPLNMGLSADLDVIVCSLQTNVDLTDVSYDDMVSSGFISLVKGNIYNYNEVKDDVNSLIFSLRLESMIPDLSDIFDGTNVFEGIEKKSPEEIQRLIDLLKTVGEEHDTVDTSKSNN
jgi:hypothetical protein